jgi:hypothetical protein
MIFVPRCPVPSTTAGSGSALVRPSRTLSLTCAVSDYSTTSGYWWNWICQPPGKSLEWMGYINNFGRTDYSPSLKSLISITRDISKNNFSVHMSSVTMENLHITVQDKQ